MSPLENNSRSEDTSGPATETHFTNPLVRKIGEAVTELQTARKYIEDGLAEGRTDIKEMLTRLARLEVKVDQLPSKVWIGSVVLGGMAITTTLCTIISVAFRIIGK